MLLILYIYIYIRVVYTSCPKSFTCFFLRRKCYTRFFFSGISIFRNSSAMDSSAIGVGVAVLVGKYMQGPCSAVPDIREYQIVGKLS